MHVVKFVKRFVVFICHFVYKLTSPVAYINTGVVANATGGKAHRGFNGNRFVDLLTK